MNQSPRPSESDGKGHVRPWSLKVRIVPGESDMKVSLEHAQRLLNIWRSTSRQVLFIFSSDGISITFRGQILYSDHESFTIGDSSGNSIHVALKIVDGCDHIDSHDTSELTMHVSAGGQISLSRDHLQQQ